MTWTSKISHKRQLAIVVDGQSVMVCIVCPLMRVRVLRLKGRPFFYVTSTTLLKVSFCSDGITLHGIFWSSLSTLNQCLFQRSSMFLCKRLRSAKQMEDPWLWSWAYIFTEYCNLLTQVLRVGQRLVCAILEDCNGANNA